MNQKQNQSTGIHCKVVCNDQIRRFQFSGTEFSSLQDQVKQLLGLNREFVLKYKDNEDDMITISSTEELACAIDISHKNDGGLIRLTVYPNEQAAISSEVPIHVPFSPEHREFCHRGRGGGRGGKWGGRCSREGGGPAFHGEHGWKNRHMEGGEHPCRNRPDGEHPCRNRPDGEHPCRNRFEKRRAKLTFKRDLWNAYLNSLENAKELTPEEESRKEFFKRKVQRLDSILADFSPKDEFPSEKQGVPPTETDVCPQPEKPVFCHQKFEEGQSYEKYGRRGCNKKYEKKERKFEKKEHKQQRKEAKNSFLSEEAKAEIATLKKQIKEKKPALWALQEQVKAKKAAIKVAKETGQTGKIPELKNEIGKLKQEKLEKKAQIEPLRQRVFQLKNGK